jgi:hypothetical protein
MRDWIEEALEVRENCELGNPLLLSHDFTRPIGWKRPLAVHMEPGLSRLVGLSLLPEIREESERLAGMLRRYLKKRMVDEHLPAGA